MKKPQNGYLKLQTFIFSQIWRLEVHDQGVGGFWLPDHCLFSVSSRGGESESAGVSPRSHQDHSLLRLKPHPMMSFNLYYLLMDLHLQI